MAAEAIANSSKKVKGRDDYQHVATISANGDQHIGNLMADAMEKVGKEGVITVDEGKSTESVLEYTEGMQFDKGYLSPYFLTNPTTLETVLEDCYILIHEKKISNLAELLPLLNKVVTSGKPLLMDRRGRRERGAGDPGRQQAARRAEHLRREGPRLRRPPQSHDGRYRGRHGRQVHQRGPGPEAGERGSHRSRSGQAPGHRQGTRP